MLLRNVNTQNWIRKGSTPGRTQKSGWAREVAEYLRPSHSKLQNRTEDDGHDPGGL